ncbi:MAG: hypothetical protein JWO19_1856 [Bryobacterales bacterium]|jgi:hypothetical protein|nr:hypothetical protein [Bryobacterales bacterium]
MAVKLLIPAVLLFLGSKETWAQSAPSQGLPEFMGREVTMTVPELDADGFFPKGPASVCIEGPPQRQCYTAPEGIGKNPKVALVQIEKDLRALLFSAESGGVSGFGIHLALLRPGTGKDLENLFPSDTSVSNQSQHAFWSDLSISDAQIFVTAEYVYGPDEGHYGEHRYIISAYVQRSSSMLDGLRYYLEDRYMTVHRYDLDANADVLTSEKEEILARLGRIKAETERLKRTLR